MALVIQGEDVLREQRTQDKFEAAVKQIQEAYRTYGDHSERRTPDEIIGYNEHGQLDE